MYHRGVPPRCITSCVSFRQFSQSPYESLCTPEKEQTHSSTSRCLVSLFATSLCILIDLQLSRY